MPDTQIHAEELFGRVEEMLRLAADNRTEAGRVMHEVLVLTCSVGVKDSRQAFGNLFSQVDFICKQLQISTPERIAIQQMRRHSNSSAPLSDDDLLADARALCRFIAAVFGTSVPHHLARRFPSTRHHATPVARNIPRHLRCIVRSWDDTTITAVSESSDSSEPLHIDYTEFAYLKDILREGMQLNVLEASPPSPLSCREGVTNGVPLKAAYPDVYTTLKGFAVENRKNPTLAEDMLWQLLRNRQTGMKFRRQHPVGDYIVDFVCLEQQLAVEVDGDYHKKEEQKENDTIRTAYLESKGYRVLRFKNEEVINEPQRVLNQIITQTRVKNEEIANNSQHILNQAITQSAAPLSVGEGLGVRHFPRLIVLEPDFLIDISAIAACFEEHGRHPWSYLVKRMEPREISQPMLLGNFAGSMLDDIINNEQADVNETIRNNFKEKALEFCACDGFDAQRFVRDARSQAQNMKEVVEVLFGQGAFDRKKAILEPSFVCEKLGIQGRVDLMTTDMRLLVEQKSGKNFNIESCRPNATGSFQLEQHYVQLLLYYGVLRYNFDLPADRVDIRLLYSKYPAARGLVVVAYYRQLFRNAMEFRNRLVAEELRIADEGFDSVADHLTTETLNENQLNTPFFNNYIRPRLDRMTLPLHHLSPVERAYYTRMMTFVYREQRVSKLGDQQGHGNSGSDLWNMPLSEKQATGNIYCNLTLTKREKSSSYNGFDTLTLHVPDQGSDFLPNFRRGDMVYLYSYRDGEEPDVRRSILYKGVLQGIQHDELVVHLNDGQQNATVFPSTTHHPTTNTQHPTTNTQTRYAIEHGGSDINTSSAIRGLYRFITSDADRRALLLGQRAPRRDVTRQLSRSYNAAYDDILLRARQAEDYFLLVGPPGTGKTSMALRFMVEEASPPAPLSCREGENLQPDTAHPSSSKPTRKPSPSLQERGAGGEALLLLSYTNRAVDEICEMLVEAGFEFLRIGNEYSCDARFKPYLLEKTIEETPRLDAIRQRIDDAHIVVGTTSMLQSRSFIFNLKHFSTAIIDEASQILEPDIIGLLSLDAIGRFILMGDYKQLPAVVQQGEAESRVDDPLLHDICLDDCRHSLFERLIRHEQRQGRSDFIGILRHQGRMHPDIAAFPSRMFYAREQLSAVPCPHQQETALGYDLPAEDALDDLLKSKRLVFVETYPDSAGKATRLPDTISASPEGLAGTLLRRIHRFYGTHFDPQKTVGVIVPYRNKIAAIRRETEKLGIPELEQVTIDTVERYQGSQRDVIIFDFSVEHRYQLDFLTASRFSEDGQVIDRKLNVAITRARRQLILTGNPRILNADPVFRQLTDFIKDNGGYARMS